MRPMIIRAAAAALLAIGTTGCAAIWGFEDALDLPDGASGPLSGPEAGAPDMTLVGVDGTTDASMAGEAAFDEAGSLETGAGEGGASEGALAEAGSTDA